MAVWTLVAEGDMVRLTWSPNARPEKLAVQECGRTEAAAGSDLLAWVASEAAPLDLIQTDRGQFVKTYAARQVRA